MVGSNCFGPMRLCGAHTGQGCVTVSGQRGWGGLGKVLLYCLAPECRHHGDSVNGSYSCTSSPLPLILPSVNLNSACLVGYENLPIQDLSSLIDGIISSSPIMNSSDFSEECDSRQNMALERSVNKLLYPSQRERGKKPRIQKVSVSCTNHCEMLTNDLR